jgi:photoactive yellow protein
MDWSFSDQDLFERLDAADDAALDGVPFGVVAMALSGIVTKYNTAESRLAGLSPAKVVGGAVF